jgi:hypothetical protein
MNGGRWMGMWIWDRKRIMDSSSGTPPNVKAENGEKLKRNPRQHVPELYHTTAIINFESFMV